MMILVNVSGDQISGSYNGIPFGVSFDQKKYQAMLDLKDRADNATDMAELQAIIEEFKPLTEESYKDLVETVCPYVFANKHTNKFYLSYNGKISSKAIPQVLVDRMIKSVEKQIDINPLVKFWVRFMRNPNFSDSKAKLVAEYISAPYVNQAYLSELVDKKGLNEKVAREKATSPQVSITKEGLLVGYKVSREVRKKYELNGDEDVVQKSRYTPSVDPDTGMVTYAEPDAAEDRLFEPPCMGQGGDAFFCEFNGQAKEGHFIRVGGLHYLDDWKKVDCNDLRSGVKGLHVGGLSYIAGYQTDGTVTHNVFIDPMDIGAIVGLGAGNDGAMRVRRYFVYSSFIGVNRNIYHSSTYAALTDAEYEKMVAEAVAATEMTKKELDAQLDEKHAIAK